ncbi:MAG: YlmC/YmxH family sporulation protein [Firmicutes bacterium]|nr:YlmC/YmxH family sporulation protein [Bacillota bacterium]
MNRGIRELECLNVVNLCDGKILGTINDVEIDTNCGKIVAVSVSSGKGIFQGITETIRICWEQIKCIGEDIILVEYKREPCCDKSNSRKKLHGWFWNF